MSDIKLYQKTTKQSMEPWTASIDMARVSISQADLDNGSPKQGDMIAHNKDLKGDSWLIAKKFFEDNYKEVT